MTCTPKVEIDAPEGSAKRVAKPRGPFVVERISLTEDERKGVIREEEGLVEL